MNGLTYSLKATLSLYRRHMYDLEDALTYHRENSSWELVNEYKENVSTVKDAMASIEKELDELRSNS